MAAAAVFTLRVQSLPPSPPPPVELARAPDAAPAPLAPPPGAELVKRGLAAAQNGAVGEAVDWFRKAVEVDGRNAETWNSLGVVLVRQGSWADGIDAFRRAVKIDPGHAEAHRNLAVALDRRGRATEAIAHYRAFVAGVPATHPDRDRARARLDQLGAAR